MEKKYRRTRDIYVLILIVGMIIVIDSFRLDPFIWLYDGIKFLIALLVALYGLWGILIPYATLTEKKLQINATILKTKIFDLAQETTITFNDREDTIEISDNKKSHLISTRNIKKSDRSKLKNDLQKAENQI